MVALPALVSGLDAELVRLGCKDSTMVWYRGCWRRLQKYFAARGAGEFSLDVAMAWPSTPPGRPLLRRHAGGAGSVWRPARLALQVRIAAKLATITVRPSLARPVKGANGPMPSAPGPATDRGFKQTSHTGPV